MKDGPVSYKDFLAAIPAEDRAALTARADGPGFRHLALYLGLIVVLAVLIVARVPLWPVLMLPLGILLTFLFTLEHECTHKTPFASPRLNEAVGHLCGAVLIVPFRWFRYFHLAHHRWTNIAGRDPELAAPKPATRGAWLWHVSGVPHWRAMIGVTLRLAAGRERGDYLPEQARAGAAREARLLLALYGLVALSIIASPLALWLWVVPMLIGQPFLRLYLLAEHGDCDHVTEMFANTRTTFTTRAVLFLAWNMPYHTEHHVWPMVPFHRLPDLHRRMKAHLRVTERGYARFTRAYLDRRGLLPGRGGQDRPDGV